MTTTPLRTRLHLTQAKFAQLLGVGTGAVSSWETGKIAPDANNAALIKMLDAHPDPTPLYGRLFDAGSQVERGVILSGGR
jgi:transcriptional regulator with XRE-family HTH domain